ncbi:MAG: RNA 2',3'-cyclic phosphodiesterase [Propionibacteriaceae bacterium]|jgi:2'-5' RNA ligase|nr:RNA 2',3'-cyclic phosphodiesterase [Propionibacteriaceae bacterium]
MAERLFAAVIPPAALVDALEAFIGPRRDQTPPWRWVRPETWHITLAFLGDVDDDRRDALSENLGAIKAAGFPIRMGGAGAFRREDIRDPGGDLPGLKAKVVWMGASADELAPLSANVRAAASRAGVRPDGSKFQAHITLARSRKPAPARGLLDVVASFGSFDFQADAFHLVKSTLTPSGSVYDVVETWPLG